MASDPTLDEILATYRRFYSVCNVVDIALVAHRRRDAFELLSARITVGAVSTRPAPTLVTQRDWFALRCFHSIDVFERILGWTREGRYWKKLLNHQPEVVVFSQIPRGWFFNGFARNRSSVLTTEAQPIMATGGTSWGRLFPTQRDHRIWLTEIEASNDIHDLAALVEAYALRQPLLGFDHACQLHVEIEVPLYDQQALANPESTTVRFSSPTRAWFDLKAKWKNDSGSGIATAEVNGEHIDLVIKGGAERSDVVLVFGDQPMGKLSVTRAPAVPSLPEPASPEQEQLVGSQNGVASRGLISNSDMRLVEDVLKMGTGYVLDFSDRTFTEFFLNEFDIDIDADRFKTYGTSKAKRLRTLLRSTEPPLLGQVLTRLLEYRLERDSALRPEVSARYRRIAASVGGTFEDSQPSQAKAEHPAPRLPFAKPATANAATTIESSRMTTKNPDSGWTDNIQDYRGQVDVAIVTIKPEEEDEVLRCFPREHTVRGERNYGLCRIENVRRERLLVACVRQPRQGNIHANAVVKDIIADLDPGWILLVGIAGASPFGDAVIGDVVLGTHTHDLTVHARNADGTTGFSAGGGSATVDVEATVVHVRPNLVRAMASEKCAMPAETLTFTTDDDEVNKRIAASLRARSDGRLRVFDGPIISTDALVKDVDLVKQWRSTMRNALAVEMESAGAYNAARTRARTYAMLPVRGISDIVGLEKQEGAVLHACKVAADCTLAFVRELRPAQPTNPNLPNEPPTVSKQTPAKAEAPPSPVTAAEPAATTTVVRHPVTGPSDALDTRMIARRVQRKNDDKTLSSLVGDWGGFKDLVAAINRTSSDLRVERNVELPAKEGGTYKIDVVIRSKQGLHDIMTIVECKWWEENVGKDRITHLKHIREQVGAQKAVCFTSVGFEAGANTVARAHDIGLFLLKPMSEEDWGKPGKTLDIVLQIHQAAISPLAFPSVRLIAPSGAPEALNPPRPVLTESSELKSVGGKSTLIIRELLREIRQMAFNHANTKRRVWHEGAPGKSYVAVHFRDFGFQGGEYEIQLGRFPAYISKFNCDVIFEIRQDRVVVDRGKNLDFALVVEDFILGERYAGSKRKDSDLTECVKLEPTMPGDDGAVQNGEIMCVLVDGFQNYAALRAAKLDQDPATNLIPA